VTGINHAVTGAVVALVVKEPLLALPIALLSHFAIDCLPHWDYKIPKHLKRRHLIIAADLVLSILLTVALAMIAGDLAWLVLACSFLAILPDAMWLSYIIWGKPSPHDSNTPLHLLRRFHFKIQWSETAHGAVVEMLWFALMSRVFLNLTG